MKKFLMISLTLLLAFSFVSCNGKKLNKPEEESTGTSATVSTQPTTTKRYFPDDKPEDVYSTTVPSKVIGKEETSKRHDIADGEFDIIYYAPDGTGKKYEHFKDNMIRYTCVDVAVDDDGTVLREEYYDADDVLLAVYDNGRYFDGKGNQISEGTMDYLLSLVY